MEMEEVEGDDDGFCLICGDSCSSLKEKEIQPSSLEGLHNNVHFVLKHVLELPSELLDNYLKQSTNADQNYVRFCRNCSGSYVEKCKKLFVEYLEIRMRFEGARREMIDAIKVKDENYNDKRGGDFPVVNEILRFVRQNDEYDAPTAPDLISGGGVDDMLIKEEPSSPSFDDDMEFDQTLEHSSCSSSVSSEESVTKTQSFTCQRKIKLFSSNHSVAMSISSECESGSPTTKDVPRRRTFKTKQKSQGVLTNDVTSSNSTAAKVIAKYKLRVRNPVNYSTFDADEGIEAHTCSIEEKMEERRHHKNEEEEWDLDSNHLDNEKDSESEKVTCQFCNKNFPNRKGLQAHIIMRHNSNRNYFKCEHCTKEYLNRPAYRSHLTSEHQVKQFGNVKCAFESCGKLFYHDHFLRNHEKTHSKGLWKCETCESKLHSPLTLRKHKEKEHPKPEPIKNEDQRHVCKICQKELSSKNRLNYHMRTKHTNPPTPKLRQKRTKNMLRHKCSECDSTFSNKLEFRKHQNQKQAHGKPRKQKQEDPVSCPICGAILSSKLYLQRHIAKTHERKFEVSCDLCSKIFKSSINLKLHLAAIHNIGNNPNAQCPVEGCGITLRKRCLREHIQRVHESHRRAQCDVCGLKLFGKKDLKKHMDTVHINKESKPFICDECGKGFARQDYLLSHKKMHERKNKNLEELK